MIAALLLAAGKGTRLWPLTAVRAKAAVPYCGVPLVRRLAERLVEAGVTRLAANLHHLPDTVREALRGIPVTYSYEEELLGTAGALHPLRSFLQDSWFWTVNAKIDMIPFPPFAPQASGSPVITAVCAKAPAAAPYTRVDIAGEPLRVVGFRGAETQDGEGFLFTGVQLVSPRIWDFLPEPGFAHFPTDVYPRLETAGHPVRAWTGTGSWREFSTLERYLLHHVEVGADAGWWGSSTVIAPTARVSESVIWDCVVIEHGARIHQAVLADGVRIRAGRSVDRAAVVRLEQVPVIHRGEILDDNLVVPLAP